MSQDIVSIKIQGSETVTPATKKAGNALDRLTGASTKTAGAFGRLKAAATSAIDQLKSLATSGLGAAAAIAGLIKLAKDSVSAFLFQEQAENSLAVAMKNAGTFTDEAYESMKRYAAQLQTVTTFGDEVTMVTMANLQGYGMETDALKKATVAAQDLAIAKRIDLKTASDLLGKAFVGETGSLSRYGIVLDKGIENGKKFAAVLKLINDRFGGAAQAEIETYAGQLKQLSNWWGDVTEKIGYGLVKTLQGVLLNIGTVTTALIILLRTITKGLSYLPFIGDMFEAATQKLDSWGNTVFEFTKKNWDMLASNKEVAESIDQIAKKTELQKHKTEELQAAQVKAVEKQIKANEEILKDNEKMLKEYEKHYASLSKLRDNALKEHEQKLKEIAAFEKSTLKVREQINALIAKEESKTLKDNRSEYDKYYDSITDLDQQYTAALQLSGQAKQTALEQYIGKVAELADKQEAVRTGMPPEGIGIMSDTALERMTQAQEEWEKTGKTITETMRESAAESLAAAENIGIALDQAALDVAFFTDEVLAMQAEIEDLQANITVTLDDQASSGIETIRSGLENLADKTITVTTLSSDLSSGAESDISSYATGSPYIPKSGLAYIHKGEAIIPANQNPNNSSQSMVDQRAYTFNYNNQPTSPDPFQNERMIRKALREANRASI